MPHSETEGALHAAREHDDTGDDLCVSRVPLFKSLSSAEQLCVASVARATTVAKGEQIYAAGTEVSQLMVVHTGTVKASRVDAEGHEQILRVVGPGGFMGESAFLTGRGPGYFATAMEPGSMCVFWNHDLGRLINEYPLIGVRMLQAVSRRLEETEARLAAVISADVTSRLAGYLLSLESRPSSRGIEVELPMAKKDVASLLDTTPESLSRQLRRLHQSGVIDNRGPRQLVILDVEALLDRAAHS